MSQSPSLITDASFINRKIGEKNDPFIYEIKELVPTTNYIFAGIIYFFKYSY